MKTTLLLLSLTLNSLCFALSSYYDSSAVVELTSGNLSDDSLLNYVGKVASKNFKPLGYKKNAKKQLFGYVDLKQDDRGYYVKDVYCNYEIRAGVGPLKVPANEVMNVEHTWPQSKGAKAEPGRGDLHHLFPTDSRANSARGNHPFGEISNGKDARDNCEISQRGNIDSTTGKGSTGTYGFEPPIEHRGNVARAMFYVSAKYKYRLSELEEYYLRKWHTEDPVDADEISRNDKVQEAQGNRNPFIDYPQLVKRVSDF